MHIRSIAAGLVAATLLGSIAHGADLYVPDEAAPMMEESGFSWDGLYVGIEAGTLYYTEDNSYALVGVNVGVNYLPSDGFLLGLEGDLQYLTGDNGEYAHFVVLGRAGVIVMPQLLLYAAVGGGIEYNLNYDTSFGIYEVGVGAELAVSDTVTVRGQVLGLAYADPSDGDPGVKATLGIELHF